MIKKYILILILSYSTLLAQTGWYLGNTCESIKEFDMKSPLDLISVYNCKPNNAKHVEVSADMGLLAFDCTNSDLSGYMNLIFGKQRCLKIQDLTNKKINAK